MIHPKSDAVQDDGHHGDALEPRVVSGRRREIWDSDAETDTEKRYECQVKEVTISRSA
jgi:hypothetical protein